jgi:hypothetical protein
MNAYEPYWQHDLFLGEGVFSPILLRRIRRRIRMLLHVVTDDNDYFLRQEIVPISQPDGMRTVVHARPYLWHPGSWLGTLLRRMLYGRVPDIPYETLGDCRAWYYHTDRVLILRDCYRFADSNPRTDQNLATIWQGFENLLLALFPDTLWIATPSWEPVYATQDWQAFLLQQGYHPCNHQAFLKEVPKPAPRLRG